MVGLADDWYSQQKLEFRQRNLSTWEGWVAALRPAFQGDIAEKEAQAIARKWEYRSEYAAAYFFQKHRMIKSCWPHRDPASIARDIWRGLPESYQGMIREQFSANPNLDTLLEELNQYENTWR
ncbi:hypothetical protein BCV69DRAFT_253506, partial [Microstroma glucosiphilum]